jgi:hypothetical protein
MHYTDLMLKFASEEEAKANLYDKVATAWDNSDPENPVETEWEYRPRFRNIDTLGVIYTGGSWDAEGNEIEAPVAEDGWHVNLRCLEGENAVPLYGFLVAPTPATPRRVWA